MLGSILFCAPEKFPPKKDSSKTGVEKSTYFAPWNMEHVMVFNPSFSGGYALLLVSGRVAGCLFFILPEFPKKYGLKILADLAVTTG